MAFFDSSLCFVKNSSLAGAVALRGCISDNSWPSKTFVDDLPINLGGSEGGLIKSSSWSINVEHFSAVAEESDVSWVMISWRKSRISSKILLYSINEKI